MNMLKTASAELSKLRSEITFLKSELKNAPEGALLCRKNGSYSKWYHQKSSGEAVYIPKKHKDLAVRLSRKAYANQKLECLKREASAIESYLAKHDAEYDTPIISRLPQGIRDLLPDTAETFGTAEEDLSEWQRVLYRTNPFFPEKRIVPVTGHLFVRSKSEAFIAAALLEKNIPFRYECELSLSGSSFYPDFTIRHPGTGQVFLWEHLGLMDQENYREKTLSKLYIYFQHGYMPSINLILTSETKNAPLSYDLVKRLISLYFE